MLGWLLNPLFEWFFWLIQSCRLLIISGGRVRLGYLSRAKNCRFEGPNMIYPRSILRSSEFGAYSYVAEDTKINHTRFGKFCSIGSGCYIGVGIHPSSGFISTHPAFFSVFKQAGVSFAKEKCLEENLPIIVGNDVWIGVGVIILDGVKIGNGAIIAAGSVVTKEVSAYHVIGGVPAQLIRVRYSPEEIQQIEEFAWWDKPESWLAGNVELFRDEEAFFHMLNDKTS